MNVSLPAVPMVMISSAGHFMDAPETDLNNNGKPELILKKRTTYEAYGNTWTNNSDTYLEFYESDADNQFSLKHTIVMDVIVWQATFVAVDTGDSDNDNLKEVLTTGRIGNDFHVRLYEAETTNSYPSRISWDAIKSYDNLETHSGIGMADTDNDGKQEIITIGTAGSETFIKIYENTGNDQYSEIALLNVQTPVPSVQGFAILDGIQ